MVTAVDMDGNSRILYAYSSETADMGAYEDIPFDFRVEKVEKIPDGHGFPESGPVHGATRSDPDRWATLGFFSVWA